LRRLEHGEEDDAVTTELRTARVLHVEEAVCQVWTGDGVTEVGFAPMFPTPRTERVSPGHLVALAAQPGRPELVVWRWYDAVVLDLAADGTVDLWEPAHGRVRAQRRPMFQELEPGSRAFASAGLPEADWWVAGPATRMPDASDIDLAEVNAFYVDNDLWDEVFAP
jgi:hypothetical protein